MSKKVSRRDFLKSTLMAAGAVGLTACGVKPTEVAATSAPKVGGSADAIRIGVIQPLSGAAQLQGNMMKYSYNYAAGIINKQGGIKSMGGAPIELVWGDHQNKQDLAVNETERLIQQEKVCVMTGASTSGTVMAATTAAERLQVPFATDVAGATNITERGLKFVFRVGIIGTRYGETFGDYIKYVNENNKAGLKKMAFVYPDTEAARSFLGACVDRAKKDGYEVVFNEAFPADLQDFTTLMTRVKVAEPDVITFNDASLASALQYLRQAAAVKVKPKVLLHTGGTVEFQDWIDGAGPLGDGYSYMGQWNPDVPGGKELYDDFLAVTGQKLAGFNSIGIQTIYTVCDALERAASRNPLDIQKALQKTSMKPGPRMFLPWQGIEFDEKGQNKYASNIVVQFFGNKRTTVFPEASASSKPNCPFEYFKNA